MTMILRTMTLKTKGRMTNDRDNVNQEDDKGDKDNDK